MQLLLILIDICTLFILYNFEKQLSLYAAVDGLNYW